MLKLEKVKEAIVDTNLGTTFYGNNPKAFLRIEDEKIIIIGFEKQNYYKQLVYHDLLTDTILTKDEELRILAGTSDEYLPLDVIIFYADIIFQFIEQLKHEDIKKEFEEAFRGINRVVNFKKTLIKYDLIEDFYQFKDKLITVEAINWCVNNKIDFER